ncbi:hypothetical protein GLOIN_2v229933 [Rhizophagus irregularis DAOM 181602=DAOM 197198]|nr:hypothetical protein GLOIN_2v229933 [Rhizophagus irregularis DAOM 181602=DAOM 197198]
MSVSNSNPSELETRCIQIAKEILHEEPIIEYRPSFMQGLELYASKNIELQLKVQGAQHRLHSTSWYKDVRDWQKRCICLDNLDSGIILLEVWYDQKPEIVIPERIQKIKEFVDQASKSFALL